MSIRVHTSDLGSAYSVSLPVFSATATQISGMSTPSRTEQMKGGMFAVTVAFLGEARNRVQVFKSLRVQRSAGQK